MTFPSAQTLPQLLEGAQSLAQPHPSLWKSLFCFSSLWPSLRSQPGFAMLCGFLCHLAPRWFDPKSVGLITMGGTDVGRGKGWDPQAHRTAGFSLCSGQILTGAGFSCLLPSWILQHGTQAVTNQSNYSPCSQPPYFPPLTIDFGNTV